MMEKLLTDNFDKNYSEIKENIKRAAEESGRKFEDIKILAATKTVDCDLINYGIESGISYIGENRVQEFLLKKDNLLPCNRHFIGHLQTNKVKDIVPFVSMIHSVDSYHLAKEISKVSQKENKTTEILLEVNIGNEKSKSGFLPEELLTEAEKISKLPNILIKGLMAIPPICEKNGENLKYFNEMNKLFIDISAKKMDNSNIDTLSMGMSDDYYDAVLCGATIVRIGTALFGKRDYSKKV